MLGGAHRLGPVCIEATTTDVKGISAQLHEDINTLVFTSARYNSAEYCHYVALMDGT
jgi:hypothetical protein